MYKEVREFQSGRDAKMQRLSEVRALHKRSDDFTLKT